MLAPRNFRWLALPLMACMLGGCAHYRFDIVSPENLRRPIPQDSTLVIRLSPMEYRMQAVENHLVIRVFNISSDPIRFLGDQSTIVDPGGQSHAMYGQAIAPGAYMKLILPPMVEYVAYYPYTTVGVGFGYGWHHRFYGGWHGAYWYDPLWDEPAYVPAYEPNQPYWRWYGPGDVKLMLTFQHGTDKPFTQAWAFDRVRD